MHQHQHHAPRLLLSPRASARAQVAWIATRFTRPITLTFLRPEPHIPPSHSHHPYYQPHASSFYVQIGQEDMRLINDMVAGRGVRIELKECVHMDDWDMWDNP